MDDSSLADTFNDRIRHVNVYINSPVVWFTFTDGSKLRFEIKSRPVAKADGPKDSYAKQFSNSVKMFVPLGPGHFSFEFSDGSKCEYRLEPVSQTPDQSMN